MTVKAITPDPNSNVLPGAIFADCYRLETSGQLLDAIAATQRVIGRNPRWISRLMKVRNLIVAPLGLKAAPDVRLAPDQSIGTFPLISKSPERVVLGLDDRHLDFRVVVDVATNADGEQTVSATTYVKTHNALGSFYLAVVKPFHRIIMPVMLAQATKS